MSIDILKEQGDEKSERVTGGEDVRTKQVLDGIIRVHLGVQGTLDTLSVGDINSLPDIYQSRLGKIIGSTDQDQNYARAAMLLGLRMYQKLKIYVNQEHPPTGVSGLRLIVKNDPSNPEVLATAFRIILGLNGSLGTSQVTQNVLGVFEDLPPGLRGDALMIAMFNLLNDDFGVDIRGIYPDYFE